MYTIISGTLCGERLYTCIMLAGLGAVILMDVLDYETAMSYELTVRASDVVTGSVADTVVHIIVEVNWLYSLLLFIVYTVHCIDHLITSVSEEATKSLV